MEVSGQFKGPAAVLPRHNTHWTGGSADLTTVLEVVAKGKIYPAGHGTQIVQPVG